MGRPVGRAVEGFAVWFRLWRGSQLGREERFFGKILLPSLCFSGQWSGREMDLLVMGTPFCLSISELLQKRIFPVTDVLFECRRPGIVLPCAANKGRDICLELAERVNG